MSVRDWYLSWETDGGEYARLFGFVADVLGDGVVESHRLFDEEVDLSLYEFGLDFTVNVRGDSDEDDVGFVSSSI